MHSGDRSKVSTYMTIYFISTTISISVIIVVVVVLIVVIFSIISFRCKLQEDVGSWNSNSAAALQPILGSTTCLPVVRGAA